MLVIVDYGVGNLSSIRNMLKKGGSDSTISGQDQDISKATRLILPGMGHFDHCMQKFNESGLRSVIEKKVFEEKVPILGICVGLQMFMASSEEGKEAGLGWLSGATVRFKPDQMNPVLKIPNMGWLDVRCSKSSTLWSGLEGSRFYFAHSYYVDPDKSSDVLLTAEYGYGFVAGVKKDNITGVQFHPEKSHRFGMRLLQNFANIDS